MDIPVELRFYRVQKTDQVEKLINDRVDKLETFHSHIISCRIAVEHKQEHQTTGNPYRVRIEVRVPPGHDLVVDKRPQESPMHDPLERVITNAFKAMERQLKALSDRQNLKTKHHEVPIAFVVRLFKEQGYGFIRTPEGREIYFQNAATLHNDWGRLEVGTEVRFEETMGEMGPQATTVQIVDKPGHRVPTEEEEAVDVPRGWRQ